MLQILVYSLHKRLNKKIKYLFALFFYIKDYKHPNVSLLFYFVNILKIKQEGS